jgi:hypothetical protein
MKKVATPRERHHRSPDGERGDSSEESGAASEESFAPGRRKVHEDWMPKWRQRGVTPPPAEARRC